MRGPAAFHGPGGHGKAARRVAQATADICQGPRVADHLGRCGARAGQRGERLPRQRVAPAATFDAGEDPLRRQLAQGP